MSQLSRKVQSANQIPFILRWAEHVIGKALEGGDVLLTFSRPSKSRQQEEKYHAMIEDIRSQCFKGYSRAGMKAALINQFALERERQGEPLRHPGEQAWDWANQAPVYVRPSSKDFLKGEAADFIEFLYATGSEFSVQWSEKALAVYDEMMEARAA